MYNGGKQESRMAFHIELDTSSDNLFENTKRVEKLGNISQLSEKRPAKRSKIVNFVPKAGYCPTHEFIEIPNKMLLHKGINWRGNKLWFCFVCNHTIEQIEEK
jgi:hypothetical protein